MSEYTDKQLLEWAAKAMGYTSWGYDARDYPLYVIDGSPTGWNPLVDDADALRLAVNLRIVIDITPWASDAYKWCESRSDDFGIRHCEGADQYASTRLAIVRAASEIGRVMP